MTAAESMLPETGETRPIIHHPHVEELLSERGHAGSKSFKGSLKERMAGGLGWGNKKDRPDRAATIPALISGVESLVYALKSPPRARTFESTLWSMKVPEPEPYHEEIEDRDIQQALREVELQKEDIQQALRELEWPQEEQEPAEQETPQRRAYRQERAWGAGQKRVDDQVETHIAGGPFP